MKNYYETKDLALYPLATIGDLFESWTMYSDGMLDADEENAKYYINTFVPEYWKKMDKITNSTTADDITKDASITSLVSEGKYDEDTNTYTAGNFAETIFLPFVLWMNNVENWDVSSDGTIHSELPLDALLNYIQDGLVLYDMFQKQ